MALEVYGEHVKEHGVDELPEMQVLQLHDSVQPYQHDHHKVLVRSVLLVEWPFTHNPHFFFSADEVKNLVDLKFLSRFMRQVRITKVTAVELPAFLPLTFFLAPLRA